MISSMVNDIEQLEEFQRSSSNSDLKQSEIINKIQLNNVMTNNDQMSLHLEQGSPSVVPHSTNLLTSQLNRFFNDDDQVSDLKVLNYYKGLINESNDSLGQSSSMEKLQGDFQWPHNKEVEKNYKEIHTNNNEETQINNHTSKVTTPIINTFKEVRETPVNPHNLNHNSKFNNPITLKHNELSPLAFIDSPVRNKYQSKTLSVLGDPDFTESLDLRSIKDDMGLIDGLNYTFQYMTIDEGSHSANNTNPNITTSTTSQNIVDDTDLLNFSFRAAAASHNDQANSTNDHSNSINDIPYIKNVSMSESDFNEIFESTPPRPHKSKDHKQYRPSLSKLSRSNTQVNKEFISPMTSSVITEAKPKLKNAKSLPLLPRLNSLSIKTKNTEIKTKTQLPDYFAIPKSNKSSAVLTPYGKKSKHLDKQNINAFANQTGWNEPIRGIHTKNRSIGKGLNNTLNQALLLHSRYNSNSSSIGKNSFSIKDFQISYPIEPESPSYIAGEISRKGSRVKRALTGGKHQKSSSNSSFESGYLKLTKDSADNDSKRLPRLNTTPSSSNVFGKILKKIASPVTPRNGSFSQLQQQYAHAQEYQEVQQEQQKPSIDSIMSPSGNYSDFSTQNAYSISLAEKAKTLVKKASSGNLHHSKSKLFNRSKSNTITSISTTDSGANSLGLSIIIPKRPTRTNATGLDLDHNSISSSEFNNNCHGRNGTHDISAELTINEDMTTDPSPPLTSPVIKVNALSARFRDFQFNTDSETNKNTAPYAENIGFTKAPRTPQANHFDGEIDKRNKEALKNQLIHELTQAIEQMQTEDEAFATTLARLSESGWYSESNINSMKEQREITRYNWQEKIRHIKVKLEVINESDKKTDYNIKTPQKPVDSAERFNFES